MRILHVDDNPDDRALVGRELRRDWTGAEILAVGEPGGLEAALAGGELDVAILDFSLGWGDGVGVLERIRGVQPDCPALLFTASLGEERAVEMLRAGFDDYIVKSVGNMPRLRASVRTLFDRRLERQARALAEARHRSLFMNVGVGLFACRADGAFRDGNPALLAILGVPDVGALRRLNLLDIIDSEELRHRWLDVPPDAIPVTEAPLRRPDGQTRWVQLDARSAGAGVEGQVEGSLTDVTALHAALEQRETLLREVLHRVYNNLQQVEALLNLQGRRFEQPELRRAFREVGDRVRALALVQRKLHGGTDYRHVDFAAYLRDLVAALRRMTERPEVGMTVEADAVPLPVEQAVPAGLIVNELLVNALKHAFPGGREGGIRVAFRAGADGEVLLEVADDGIGANGPQAGQPTYGGGLGSRLVPALARQIGGKVTIEDTGRGMVVRVRFPG